MRTITVTTSTADLWHKRLGHLCRYGMKLMQDDLVTGAKFTGDNNKICVSLEGKQARCPFKKINYKRATAKLELIHSDMCGPMSIESIDEKRYLLIFVDNYSRKICGYILKSKTEVLAKFIQFKAFVENQTGLKLKAFKSGTEYANENFQNYLAEQGIKHETTIPYSP